MKNGNRISALVFALLLFTVCVPRGGAQVPRSFSYQGVLTDQAGNAAADGNYALTFFLYTQEIGGAAVWSENHTVAVRNGVFNTVLGNSTPLNLPSARQYWLTMTISGGSELEPRTQLAGVPYSLFSSSTESIEGLAAGGVLAGSYPDPALAAQAVGTSNIADAAVTAQKLSAGPGAAGKVLGSDGTALIWTDAAGFSLPYSGQTGGSSNTFTISNIGQGSAIVGRTSVNASAIYGSVGPPDTSITEKAGVRGDGMRLGVLGTSAPASSGVNVGVRGISDCGVIGQTPGAVVPLPGKAGVVGLSETDYGVLGKSLLRDGVFGTASADNRYGLRGEASGAHGHGVYAKATGSNGFGIYARSEQSAAGYFRGFVSMTDDCTIGGHLSAGSKSFRIDHPQDPGNKYLQHVSVESPDMLTVYNGNAECDAEGKAAVALPAYFEDLNMEFRYQLTCVGGFAPVYVAEEVADNRFVIAGGTPGLKVSWQITGIRKDPYAVQHRVKVEIEKPASERGRYLHPEAYGVPASDGVHFENERTMPTGNAGGAAEMRPPETVLRSPRGGR